MPQSNLKQFSTAMASNALTIIDDYESIFITAKETECIEDIFRNSETTLGKEVKTSYLDKLGKFKIVAVAVKANTDNMLYDHKKFHHAAKNK